MLHVPFHLRACVCVDVARSHVKHLLRRELQGKKNPTPNLQVIFWLKAFLRKALHCAGEGVTTKVPLGQLSQHVQHNNLHRICGGGGILFFKRDACMHNTSHHAVTCLKSLQDFNRYRYMCLICTPHLRRQLKGVGRFLRD